ncbi:MAG: ATP-binding cassette domain-containing protein [Ruminiclostridium sp.]|nr:ATP-binding cassette domain-containing protein [Ruminiclostridium sp.]
MALKAENLTKSFGDNLVIDRFSHEFAENTATVIMGPSGCGKSTLLSMLMGILPPDSGTVIRNPAKIGAVFQEDRLCENLSVQSNLRLVVKGKRKFDTELEAVGLAGCEKKPVRELSGGMKRRIALLRALIYEPDILFLDEPFKGLDSDTKRTVMEYCKQKTAGKTVILVTHDKEEADIFAGEIITLE